MINTWSIITENSSILRNITDDKSLRRHANNLHQKQPWQWVPMITSPYNSELKHLWCSHRHRYKWTRVAWYHQFNGLYIYGCHKFLPSPLQRRTGPVFCLLLRVSSDYAQPIAGQVTEVTCFVIGWAQPELTRRQKTGPAQWWRGPQFPVELFVNIPTRSHLYYMFRSSTISNNKTIWWCMCYVQLYDQLQAIAWTNYDVLSIKSSGPNLIGICTKSKKNHDNNNNHQGIWVFRDCCITQNDTYMHI